MFGHIFLNEKQKSVFETHKRQIWPDAHWDMPRVKSSQKSRKKCDGTHFEKEREPGCIHVCVCMGDNSPGALKNALLYLLFSM